MRGPEREACELVARDELHPRRYGPLASRARQQLNPNSQDLRSNSDWLAVKK